VLSAAHRAVAAFVFDVFDVATLGVRVDVVPVFEVVRIESS
jgi:hypothetical protein